jgi:PAS domain S-box-containing protein
VGDEVRNLGLGHRRKFVWSSSGHQFLFGRGDDEITENFDIEDNDNPWVSRLHPDDRERALRCLHDHWENDTPYEVEYSYRLPDGEYTWIRSLGQVVRAPDGRPLRMVGMNVDISGPKWAEAKREIEARLSAVLENAPVAIIWKDANGKYEYANSIWLKRTGLTSEQMRGKAAHDLFPHAVPLIETQDRKVVETGAAVQFEFEEEIDSHARWFIVTKFPVIDANGRVTSIVSMETDITDKKRAEQALESELS